METSKAESMTSEKRTEEPRRSGSGRAVLIVDDDAEMRGLVSDVLAREGYRPSVAESGEAALAALADAEYDLVLTDLKMGGMDGLELLSRVRELRPDIAVILITAFGSIDLAIEAMRRGAANFIVKPVKMKELLVSVEKAIEEREMRAENRLLRREVEGRYRFGNIIGKSKAMRDVFALIERVAQGTSNVLILGESGTGKELVAKALHYNGPRKDRPFVAVNCSAIPEGLLESELFGHVKGAFTGAVVSKKGLFVEANGGTIFLDEIGEMSLALQAKLLRVLQDKQVRPVGGNTGIDIDCRIITATNRDLEQAIREGRFREDLFYRLSVIPVRLPSLRERPEDIPILIDHFLDKFAKDLGGPRKVLSPKATEVLMKYPWLGNVRELENVIERLVVLTPTQNVDVSDLPAHLKQDDRRWATDRFRELPTLRDLEEQYIKYVLEHVGGQKEKAAKILGINRRTLYRKRKANPELEGVSR
jgi:DNA-binding NtrC family response regulator